MSDLERKQMEKDKESIHDFDHNLFVLVPQWLHIRRVRREPFVPVWASTLWKNQVKCIFDYLWKWLKADKLKTINTPLHLYLASSTYDRINKNAY